MRTTPELLEAWKDAAERAIDHGHPIDWSVERKPKHIIRDLIADLEEAKEQLASPYMDGYEAAKEEYRPQLIALEAELANTRKQLAEAQALIHAGQPTLDSSSIESVVAFWSTQCWRRAALDAAIAEAIADEKRNPWKQAIINELAVSYVLHTDHETDPVRALAALVDYECKVALDPAVSKEAQALIEPYRKNAEEGKTFLTFDPQVVLDLIADLEEAQTIADDEQRHACQMARQRDESWVELAATRKQLAESERRYSESVGGFKRDLQQKLDDQRSKSVRLKAKLAEAQSRDGSIAPVAAIKFSLKTDCGDQFLRCWVEGSFDAIRSEWPEAPEAVFIGADPLHPNTQQTGTAALDAAITEAIEQYRKDAERYEKLRKLNVPQFAELYKRNIRGEGRFDTLVDDIPCQ